MRSIKLLVGFSLCISLLCGCQSTSSQQRTFSSPEATAAALADASRERDRDQLKSLFGPELKRLESGDERQDDEDLQRFAAAYDRKHELQRGAEGEYTLLVGEDYWAFPAPIIEQGGKWMFDTEAGVDEVISRRIGRNELRAINACKAFVQAQRDYWVLDPDGDAKPTYASKIISSQGKRDGLYWPAAENELQSPFGPIIAEAAFDSAEIKRRAEKPEPYRGYYYRVLKQQSAAAPGGAMSFFDDDGVMNKGFALLAWPEDYDETGIMSFIVAADGKVLQKDLGEKTSEAAANIESYDPAGWTETK